MSKIKNHYDLIGAIVWDIVLGDEAYSGRALYFLVGLTPEQLLGISRMLPEEEDGRIRLAIDPAIDPEKLRELSEVHRCQLPPVRIRNHAEEPIVVVATTDSARDEVGASLGSAVRIDPTAIQSRHDLWQKRIVALCHLGGHREHQTWLECMIRGLDRSGIAKTLDQFAEFLWEFYRKERGGIPYLERIGELAPILHLPQNCIPKKSVPEVGGRNVRIETFEKLFIEAARLYGRIPYLLDSKDDPIDCAALQKRLVDFLKDDPEDPEKVKADRAVKGLIDDHLHLRHGDWLPSQQKFCQDFDWSRFGDEVFGKPRRKKPRKLEDQTVEFFQIYHPNCRDDVRDRMEDYADSPDSRKIEEFLDQYEPYLKQSKEGLKLYQRWRKALFSKKETGEERDLLSAIVLGVSKLVAANANADLNPESGLLLTVRNPDNLQTWSGLDAQTYALFRLEARLIQGVLGDLLQYRFGRWLDSQAIGEAKPRDGRQAQTLELELGFSKDGDFDPDTERVRIFWRPAAGKARPVALLFPQDIEQLRNGIQIDKGIRLYTEPLRFHDTISLKNQASLLDKNGQPIEWTTNPGGHGDPDLLDRILEEFNRIEENGEIYDLEPDRFRKALAEFHNAMKEAVETLTDKPEKFYAADEGDIDMATRLAEVFGKLCHEAGKKLAQSSEGRQLLQQIAEIGIASMGRHDKFLVIPAWHPLRLYERGQKIRHTHKVIEVLLQHRQDSALSDVAIERILQNFQELMSLWGYPEIALNKETLFTCIEHNGGYSLAVPAGQAGEWLNDAETLAEQACNHFMQTVDEYLDFNPHTESHFTAMLYNANAKSLPSMLARGLEERMVANPAFRCSLLITHQDRQIVRQTYADQTVRFQKEDVRSPAAGFLSHLRVDIRENIGKRHDRADLVFLHESFFVQSRIEWEVRREETSRLPDICSLIWPRRQKVTRSENSSLHSIVIDLIPDALPEYVTQFTNLCYLAQCSGAKLELHDRAIPVRRLSWENDSADPVHALIRNAHEAGAWVVTFDQVANRAMLTDNDIKVIRDVHVGGLNARFLISSREPSGAIKRHVKEIFASLQVRSPHGLNTKTMANRVIARVVEVCGRKVLAAGRLSRTAKEIVGLAAAIALVQAAANGQRVLWLSLDDIGSAIGIRNGKMADLLALTLQGTSDDRFQIAIRVVEAKFVSAQSADTEMNDAVRQVEQTIELLAAHLTQIDIARQEWGLALSRILNTREEFSDWSHSRHHRLLDALQCGQVDFSLAGIVVVTQYDDCGAPPIERISSPETENGYPVSGYRVRQNGLISLVEHMVSSGDVIDAEIRKFVGIPPVKLVSPLDQDSSIAGQEPDSSKAPSKPPEVPKTGPQPGAIQAPPKKPEVDRQPIAIPPTAQEPVEKNQPSGQEALWHKLRELARQSRPPEELAQEFQKAMALARELRRALMDFGMRAKLLEEPSNPVICTPNGVIVRFQGHHTLTVAKADAKRSELLTTYGIHVTDVRPGKGEVDFFVAYDERRIVDLPSVWLDAEWPDTSPKQLTSFLIGVREDTGKPLWLNLTREWGGHPQHAPHTLIAGETGSGKGVLMQNLLLQMIALNEPRRLQIHLIDPKFGVDYDWIREAPHLVGGIVYEQAEAQQRIHDLVEEMEARYAKMTAAGASSIDMYNRMQADPKDRMPRVVLMHDEMADWMAGCGEYRKAVTAEMLRIAAKGRACGFHVFMITQRATQDAVPVHVRDNLGNRLCLKVASEASSKLILGCPGAERLLGKGHLAANLNGDVPPGQNYYVAQVPYADPNALRDLALAAITAWRKTV